MRKILSLAAIALLVSGAVHAQVADHAGPRRIAVWVAIAPEQQAEPYQLLRFGGNAPHDVIMLAPSHTDAATLTQAVEDLLTVRRTRGDVSRADGAVRVRATTPPGTTLRAPLPWASRVLRDMRGAEPRQVPRVGRVRAVRIWLPVQQPS